MKNDVCKIIYVLMYKYFISDENRTNCFGFKNNSLIKWTNQMGHVGARNFEDEKCWKMFNSRFNELEHYNIIVHFNEYDVITGVEWIEDSKFDAIDKSIMYSIYEDLKKYIRLDLERISLETAISLSKVRRTIYDVLEEHVKPKMDEAKAHDSDWDKHSSIEHVKSGHYWIWFNPIKGCHCCLSAGLFKAENCWKVSNTCDDQEHYNIIVHFNDNDEITNVEWIEDSKFDAIDQVSMYSIYVDLKKYEETQIEEG